MKKYDWILIYWMPYDNNLSYLKHSIIDMLSRGVQHENILVLIESDSCDRDGLSRTTIRKGHVDSQTLEETNSAREDVFASYLSWAKEQYSAENWGVIFLGHGGRLDEISPDEHPEPDVSERQWFNIEKVSKIVTEFRSSVEGDVEFVFLQNCCKGTLEAHYTFQHATQYTLSSQTVLGAPNYYYEQLLQFLGSHPRIGGGEAVQRLMGFERSDMYNSYAATYNPAMSGFSSEIHPLIESLVSSSMQRMSAAELQEKRWAYTYFGELFVDVIAFFQEMVLRSGLAPDTLNTFTTFFKHQLIYALQESPSTKHPNLSGLSLFIPAHRKELEKYRYLQVFSDLKLEELFNSVLLFE